MRVSSRFALPGSQRRARPDHHRRLADGQAAPHGLLAKVGDLGLELLEVRHTGGTRSM